MTNQQISATFRFVANALEYLGDSPFKVRAYRVAADAIDRLDIPLVEALQTGMFQKIPGIGKAILEKAKLLVETGSFPLLDRVKQQLPAGVQELLALPGVTGRAILAIAQKFPIQNAEQLRAAIESGRVQAERFTPAISAVIKRLSEWR